MRLSMILLSTNGEIFTEQLTYLIVLSKFLQMARSPLLLNLNKALREVLLLHLVGESMTERVSMS